MTGFVLTWLIPIGIVFVSMVYSLPQSMKEHGKGNLSSDPMFFPTNRNRLDEGNTTKN